MLEPNFHACLSLYLNIKLELNFWESFLFFSMTHLLLCFDVATGALRVSINLVTKEEWPGQPDGQLSRYEGRS